LIRLGLGIDYMHWE